MIAIHLDAGHSKNGNPRRGYVITDDNAQFIDYVDEGYLGDAALRRAGFTCPITQRIEVKPSVLRELRKEANSRQVGSRRVR
jgi:hypothetical protein